MARRDPYIVGLDVGTSKVCAVIGEPTEDNDLEIIGVGVADSDGQKKGSIVDVDSTVESIKSAVEEAELMAGTSVDRAYVGISGAHIRGFNSRGAVTINGRARQITEEDIRRVVDAARALDLPPGRELLHLIPQEFSVDEQGDIVAPLGMSGSRLEVEVHLVVGALSVIQTLVTCVNRAGIEAHAIVLEQLASNEAVLTDDERELGVALVDIGGGTTDLICLVDGSVCHTAVLPSGGDHLTNDIAVGLSTPITEAEVLNASHGCVDPSLIDPEQTIEIPGIGGRGPRLLARGRLCEILQPRAIEILDLVANELHKAGFLDQLNAGLVLTGGGSLVDGFPELTEQRFGLPVRSGQPIGIEGLIDIVSSPIYSTAVGLVLYGHYNRDVVTHFNWKGGAGPNGGGLFGYIGGRVSGWLGDLF